MSSINSLLSEIKLPPMALARQSFPDHHLNAPVQTLREQFFNPSIRSLVQPGMSIAVTAGSRGLHCYPELMKELILQLKELGAKPFIVPAMGSHGGATAQGQKELLEGYGITEEAMGAPVRSSMDTVQAALTDSGEPVWMDRYAWEADGIVLFNRIKPHTGFRGGFESGLVKMAAIGLGKQKGAETVHRGGPALMAERVRDFGTRAIQASRVLFGVATVEDSFDRVCGIRVLTAPEILAEEPRLLEQAKAMMPSILLEELDVLIVDRIGKNISGPGMDPNITHTYLPGAPIPEDLRAKRARRVVVLDLTEETHGAAMGIGMADITTRRLWGKMDLEATYPNCLTSGATHSAKLPMFFDSHRLAIQAAVKTLSQTDKSNLRIVRIRDTLHLEEIWISQALLPEAEKHPGLQLLSSPQPLPFDQEGNLF